MGNWFASALLLLFVALKLTGYIDWSWWWVMAPLWIPLSIAIVGGIIYTIAIWLESPRQRAARKLEEYGDALRRKP